VQLHFATCNTPKTKIYCSIIFFISIACSFNEKLHTEKKTETDEEEEEKFDKRENALFLKGLRRIKCTEQHTKKNSSWEVQCHFMSGWMYL